MDSKAFAEGRRLRGIYRVDRMWTPFAIIVFGLVLAAIGFQLLFSPDLRLPGSNILYARFLASCNPDAEQAGMMASRTMWAVALSGAVVFYLIRTLTAPTGEDRTALGLKPRHAYGFVFLLAVAEWMFLSPETRGGQALTCDQALRNQFEFWRTAVAAVFMAIACHVWTEALNARRR